MRASFMALTLADIAEPRPLRLFMTLPPYTRTRKGEVHSLGLGVRKSSCRVRSRPASATSESIEQEGPATSAEETARCTSRGNNKATKIWESTELLSTVFAGELKVKTPKPG